MSIDRAIITFDQARVMYQASSTITRDVLLTLWSKKELESEPLPKKFEELRVTEGFRISNNGKVLVCEFNNPNISDSYHSEKEALSAIAMAKLSHLKAAYNEGWVPDWKDRSQIKFVIRRARTTNDEQLHPYTTAHIFEYLTFKDASTRDLFLSNFRTLILQYFQL